MKKSNIDQFERYNRKRQKDNLVIGILVLAVVAFIALVKWVIQFLPSF